MPPPPLIGGRLTRMLTLLLFAAALNSRPASSRTAHGTASPADTYSRANRLRAALEAQPERSRTRRAYEPVLATYRAVYHGNPAAPHADASIHSVAELLAEEGRLFHDRKASLDAIGQYEFLRREYPGSRYRAYYDMA